MKSEEEKADVQLLYQLKDQKRRFIVLDPCKNAQSVTNETGRPVLKLNYYEALINARVHISSLKGKYAFVFDLENESHLYKLKQLLSSNSSYHIYTDTKVAGLSRT